MVEEVRNKLLVEEVERSYLRNKLSSILEEAEGDPSSPSRIISRFRSIERSIDLISNNVPIDLLYKLIAKLSECRVFAAQAKGCCYCFRLCRFNTNMTKDLNVMEKEVKKIPTTGPDPAMITIPNNNNDHKRMQQTYPAQDPSLIMGFESEAQKIEAWLLTEKVDRRVGIVGRCGGGKTALAQKVFGSSRIQEEFSPRIWVCLSNMLLEGEVVDPRGRVVKYILEEMGHEYVSECEYSSVPNLVEKLKRGLMGKRYLIVLDDVWRVDEWYPSVLLAHGLPRGNGGAVIATGRQEKVIKETLEEDHDHVFRMEPLLSNQICWSIFSDVVNRQHQTRNLNGHLLLIKEEQEIIQYCQGLPLAANTLGTIIVYPMSFWIPARELNIALGADTRRWRWNSLPLPEVEEVAELVGGHCLEIRGCVELKKLLPETSYSAYLVFKLNEKLNYGLEKPISAHVGLCSKEEKISITDQDGSSVFIILNGENMSGQEGARFPQPRGEEWMEIKLGEFFNNLQGADDKQVVEAALLGVDQKQWKSGLIVKGIHFRRNQL